MQYGGPPPGGYGPPPGMPGAHHSMSAGGMKPITGSPETMAMHAMTIDPRTGLPRGENPPASPAAVVSLVCGILLCLPFTGIPAIAAGALARSAIRKNPVELGGGTMALWGIGLGAFNVVVSLVFVIVLALSL